MWKFPKMEHQEFLLGSIWNLSIEIPNEGSANPLLLKSLD